MYTFNTLAVYNCAWAVPSYLHRPLCYPELRDQGVLMIFLSIHTALHIHTAFSLPSNMSELFKAVYVHLIPQIFLLRFMASLSFAPIDTTVRKLQC